jgi:hypothetical protein
VQTDLDLMVLERAFLQEQLSQNHVAAEKMRELLAQRLAVPLLGEPPSSSDAERVCCDARPGS